MTLYIYIYIRIACRFSSIYGWMWTRQQLLNPKWNRNAKESHAPLHRGRGRIGTKARVNFVHSTYAFHKSLYSSDKTNKQINKSESSTTQAYLSRSIETRSSLRTSHSIHVHAEPSRTAIHILVHILLKVVPYETERSENDKPFSFPPVTHTVSKLRESSICV